jgi:hypothetical protein
MKVLLLPLLLVCVICIGVATPEAFALSIYPTQQVGRDVSWPNCNATPPNDAAFGIVGATGGLVFYPNPCLFEEAHWFTNLSLYMNTGYAGKSNAEKYVSYPLHCNISDESCLAYNFGYNAGMYAIDYAASQYVHTNVWWLDVETENSWSTNTAYNRASLVGMVAAIKQNTLLPTIGFYSYPGQWDAITASWHNGYPNWAATGSDSYQTATSYCRGQAFNGGQTWLTQYTTRLDNDYACK